jgi:lysine 2,3-aminomutase
MTQSRQWRAESQGRGTRHYSEVPLWRDVTQEQWSDWRWQMQNSLRTVEQLEQVLTLTPAEREGFERTKSELAMAIPPYYAALMDPEDPWCPVRMQGVPTVMEATGLGVKDSLGEDAHMVTPGLVHRYPDRVLLLVNNMCQLYCRHCTRKRLTGKPNKVLPKPELEQAFAYLRAHPEVRDVLISGGDPLMMSDANLEYVLSNLRQIPSLEVLRIGTRAPVTIPQRITPKLVAMLRKFHPLWINTHFNHPKELTPEAKEACARIVDAGIPLGNQTVLLRRVNSTARIMKELMHRLVMARVRPYYIYQCDLEQGLEHFRTPVETGLEIMEALRGWTTGFAVPTYVIDAPGGGGKIPIAPSYLLTAGESKVMIRNFEGQTFTYPQPAERDSSCPYDAKWAADAPPEPKARRRRPGVRLKLVHAHSPPIGAAE